MTKSCVYDFETMSQDVLNGVVICLASLNFDEDRFITNPYTFQELVDQCQLIKFDVKEQVQKYNRTIDPDTVDWWSKQSKESQKILKPSNEDVSITELYTFLIDNVKIQECDKVYTRGGMFDPMFMESILKCYGKSDPAKWWTYRDTRSLFDGMTWGSDIKNTFIPKELESIFIKHDPCHDIAMDVMRYQILAQALHV